VKGELMSKVEIRFWLASVLFLCFFALFTCRYEVFRKDFVVMRFNRWTGEIQKIPLIRVRGEDGAVIYR
jgi:hypothetical protein